MTRAARKPHPPLGAVLALWDSPTEWFADVRVYREHGALNSLNR